MVRDGAPGAMVFVQSDGVENLFTSGRVAVDDATPLDADQHFRIASITKPFVASLVMRRVERGSIQLDDPAAKFLDLDAPVLETVKIRQLLSHRSGLFDYTADPAFDGRGDTHLEPRALLDIALTHAASFPAGARFQYSNTNYIALGLILEAVEGEPLADLLRREIFDAIGLSETSFEPDTDIPTPFIHTYERDGQELVDLSGADASQAWAAGAIVSTAHDLSRFWSAVAHGEIVSQSSWLEMSTPIGTSMFEGDYGLGVEAHDTACGLAVGHTGYIFGSQSFAFTREDGSAVVIALATSPTNSDWLPGLVETTLCPP